MLGAWILQGRTGRHFYRYFLSGGKPSRSWFARPSASKRTIRLITSSSILATRKLSLNRWSTYSAPAQRFSPQSPLATSCHKFREARNGGPLTSPIPLPNDCDMAYKYLAEILQ